MGNVITQHKQGMSWLTKTGLVLLLTLATSIFMSDGWYRPTGAEASVATINAWPATPQVVSNSNAGTATGAVTVSAGANRVMLVAIGAEYTAAPPSQKMTVTFGGRSVQQLGLNIGSTGTIWLGVVTESDLAAAVGNTLSVTNANTTNLTAMYASAAVFSGVDQVNIISGLSSVSSAAAVSNMTLPIINVKGAAGNTALSFYITNRNGQASNPDAAYTENIDYAGTNFNMAFNTLTTAVAALTTTAPVANTTTASTGSAIAVALVPSGVTGIGIIGTCGGCHFYPGTSNPVQDGSARNTPTGEFPGTHVGHVTTSAMVCTECHYNNVDHNHSTGYKNITGSSVPGTSYTSGKRILTTNTPTFGTCNNTKCHGTASPTWFTGNSTNVSCTKCHGKKVAANYSTASAWQSAPGYGGTGTDLGGASAATDAQVGAHDTHLRALNTMSARITCNQCHTVPAVSSAAGHTDSATPAEVIFSGTAVAGSGTAPSYTGGTCSNTYCHYGRSPYAPPATAQGAVGWTATGYLVGTKTAAADCGKCHASPPLSTGTHSGGLTIANCNGCHNHVNTSGVFTNPSLHIDGIVQAQGCDTCHGFPPTSGAHSKHITKIMAIKGLGTIPPGFVNNLVCGACHNDTSLTKHPGDSTTDGTSRNIYLPSATTYQQTYQFGASLPSYDKAGTTTCSNISCHLGSSTAWGTTAVTCNGCHGYPPVTTSADPDNKHAGTLPVNHIGIGASTNTKTTFVSAHGGCLICHGTQDSGSGTHSAHVNYDPVTQHSTGSMNMNGPAAAPATNSTQYDSTIRGCLNACHGSAAPYRMTASSLTLAYGSYGAGGDCVSCHATAKGTRSAVSTEFGLAWGHKKSGRGAVTKADCIVCHLEGDFTTQNVDSAYHLGLPNGNIDLRDPDGAGKTPITNNSGAAFTFTKYAISYAAGSRTTTLGNTIPEVITVKFCMKCHDSNGATNPTALTRNATNTATTGTAMMPFGGLNLGANYTVVNGAAAAGGLVNVASQFAAANSSRHPVGAANSRAYPYSTKLVAPYNNIGTTRNANTLAANTASPRVKANSVILVCDDCHTTGTTLITRMITSHGNAASLRGTYYATGPTLCTTCHIGTYNDTANGRHNTGSAFSVGTTRAASAMNNCEACHFSKISAATAVRPIKASDIHGFNNILGGAAWTYGVANGMRPIAFLRNTASFTTTSPRPYTATVAGPGQFNLAAGQSTCGGSGTIVFCNGNDNHTNYSPGGSY